MTRRDTWDLLLLGAVWGAAFLFTRIAVPHFGAVALVEVRVALAAAVLVAWLAARGQLGALRGRWGALVVIGAINTAVPFALFAYATRTVPAGFAAVLNATVPLFGALVGRIVFGERLGIDRGVGLFIGFVGVVILVIPKLSIGGGSLAVSAALSGALLYAISAHLTRRMLPGMSSLAIAAGSLVTSTALLALPALWLRPATMPPAGAWWSVVALALLATALGYVLYFRLLERVGPTGAMAVTYLIPMFGMVWGALFLREAVTATMLMGCGFILGGVAVTTGIFRSWVPSRRLPPSP
ncbi:MAG: DMT family transporter [Gemmatimonadaceae bacterium]|nr:DMT family transporter [Gemmatimonadaceae bacterium]MCW5826914.1 DMT family transporter [Gemmatimonadaceae bacterium]